MTAGFTYTRWMAMKVNDTLLWWERIAIPDSVIPVLAAWREVHPEEFRAGDWPPELAKFCVDAGMHIDHVSARDGSAATEPDL